LQCCCDLLRWRPGFKAQNRYTSLLPSRRLSFLPPLSNHTVCALLSFWNTVANTSSISRTIFKDLRQSLHKVRKHVPRAYRRLSHAIFELLPVYHRPRFHFSLIRESFGVANMLSAFYQKFRKIARLFGKLWLYLRPFASPLAQHIPASRSDKTYHHKQKLTLCL
jgi:hypothetical protein